MSFDTAPSPQLPKCLAWLSRIYSYIGAHTNQFRAENERDRALLRVAMPVVGVSWILAMHHIDRLAIDTPELIWMFASLAYALAAITFLRYLSTHPTGGVHAQYAFMAMDPLFIGWALCVAPQYLAWFLVLMLVIILRVGFRYGMTAMKVQLAFAWVSAAVPLLFSSYWHQQLQMSGSLIIMLTWAWWLCAPVIRSVERANQLELERRIERARFESLQESLQAKSEFLSRVSHELRSPLQGVISALDVIEERYSRNPEEAELLSRVRRGTMSLNTQLRDLLTLARGDAGKMEINPMPFEVCELAAAVANEVRAEAAAKELRLEVLLPEEPIFVVADPARIDQVLTNLLTNATRYTEAGSIRLRVSHYDAEDRCLRFEVSDTGPGIDKDRIPTLFDPYTRFGEITRKGDGAGLGLTVVRSVLQFLGGRVSVQSEPGIGTRFDVVIPAELLDGERQAIAERPATRILVVDDRREVLEGIDSVVRQLGFDCHTAQNVPTAANLLGTRAYDLVFVDIDMPIKNGFDLAAETRRGKGPNSSTRIVSISAADVPGDRRGWPFDGHLTKPITIQSIQRTIAVPGRPADDRRQAPARFNEALSAPQGLEATVPK